MHTSVLSAQNLVKRFRRLQAVNNVSLEVEKGSIYGILGPNGSGKSTTLGILTGVLTATSGSYQWFGQPATPALRRRIGTLLEQPNFYTGLSAYKNLKICATIKEVPFEDIERVLKLVNLWDRRNSKFKTFSTGMKQRMAIANALLGNPEVLILDEPTNGLDPQGIKEVRELISEQAQDGKTILLASHLLDEVEKVCTHVAVIQKGNVLYQGAVSSFTNPQTEILLASSDNKVLQQALQSFDGVEQVTAEGDKLMLLAKPEVTTEMLNRYLFGQGIVLTHLSTRKQSLESQFLHITSGKA